MSQWGQQVLADTSGLEYFNQLPWLVADRLSALSIHNAVCVLRALLDYLIGEGKQ